jgi:ABC-2 type transport system permease protein
MNPRHIAVLLGKEFTLGPKGFLFLLAIVGPVALSLVVTLVFGSLFAHEPTLGFADEGASQLALLIEEQTSIDSKRYDDAAVLKRAVEEGAVDGGIVIPEDFDDTVLQQDRIEIPIYIWGESLAKDRAILTATVADLVREVAGRKVQVNVDVVAVGDMEEISWSDRLFPLIVLVTVFLAGFLLTGASLLDEKEKKTIDALMVTPTTIGEVFCSKGLTGIIIAVVMGLIILAMNQALGSQPALLVLLLFLGALMAATLGLILASLLSDVPAFFATMKLTGILLYAPAIVYMFPDIPSWVGRIFPTYYIFEPIVEISQRGGGISDIMLDAIILIGLDALFVLLLGVMIIRRRQYAV